VAWRSGQPKRVPLKRKAIKGIILQLKRRGSGAMLATDVIRKK